ncbi:hypothetical protein HZC53_03455 [Candidatus Uhrbacteria bacterium]|nr:hypothetical protein [Candidatus Uhrbacteria bacterium]
MIAILTGGIGDEAGISRKSAANIRTIIDGAGFQTALFDFPGDLDRFLEARSDIECVVPVIHGKWGEDGSLQGFLELIGTPFLFSSCRAHALAIDKQKTKSVLAPFGMPVAEANVVMPGENWPAWSKPVVVKPIDSGSSYHTAICKSQDELEDFRDKHSNSPITWLIEDFCAGDEFTVGIVESEGRDIALPVIAIKPKTAFFDLEAKYDPAKCDEICPAPIPDSLSDELQRLALLAHKQLGLRHISRSDFIVDSSGNITFLETNTIPGFTSASLMPKALSTAGIQSDKLFYSWIREAIDAN